MYSANGRSSTRLYWLSARRVKKRAEPLTVTPSPPPTPLLVAIRPQFRNCRPEPPFWQSSELSTVSAAYGEGSAVKTKVSVGAAGPAEPGPGGGTGSSPSGGGWTSQPKVET